MSDNDLDQQLAALRAQAQQAQREQAQAVARREQAQGALNSVQAALAAEFPELAELGISPQDLLARLEAEAQAEVSRVAAALQVAEGSQ